ncbi:ankyrin repeat domain-containing protein [Streptomyces sp. NPDC057445]|uniref:ankyrin repeat domain-containing protein n=1 Tax=Streptomyces sp. NPDC057445 TaxID=3346136 RepID=UPI0036838EF0
MEGEQKSVAARQERRLSTMADELVQAAEEGDASLVARLLGQGVVVDTANSEGRTAPDLAAREGHREVVRLLIAAGAPIRKYERIIGAPRAAGAAAVTGPPMRAAFEPENTGSNSRA